MRGKTIIAMRLMGVRQQRRPIGSRKKLGFWCPIFKDAFWGKRKISEFITRGRRGLVEQSEGDLLDA